MSGDVEQFELLRVAELVRKTSRRPLGPSLQPLTRVLTRCVLQNCSAPERAFNEPAQMDWGLKALAARREHDSGRSSARAEEAQLSERELFELCSGQRVDRVDA